jgi:chitinase
MKKYLFPVQLNKLRDYGPLMLEATLEDGMTINLVNETKVDDDQAYAALVFVRQDGKELEVLSKRPYAEVEASFYRYIDAIQAKGGRVVITYCSFD